MLWEKQTRRATLLRNARNLARSGEFTDWEGVKTAMQRVGCIEEAERWFADHAFRAQLNQICLLAQNGHTGPRGPRGARLKPLPRAKH